MTHNEAPPFTPPSIRVSGLAKTWDGGVEAVKGIDFDVAPGEVFGLLGPNGAGKSTTIGMLTTTVVPTAGRAAAPRLRRRERTGRGAGGQRSRVPGRGDRQGIDRPAQPLTHARLWGVSAAEAAGRIAALAEDFDLTELVDRPVATYSGGQRRRLEIVRALLSDPQVLFLDEPTVGLDPRIRYELLDVIAGLRARTGATVLLTTHYLDEAERLCDRVGIMHAGAIVALDTPANLLADLGDEVLELRIDADPVTTLTRLRAEALAGEDAFAVGTTITIPVHGRPASDLAGAVGRLGLTSSGISTRRPTLDDVYLRLTGDRLAA